MSGLTMASSLTWVGTSGAAGFDPATLTLELWVRAAYAGSPWSGVASAGGSGSRNLTEATNPPTVGTALNGLDTANFDGSNDLIGNANGITTFVSEAAGTIVCLFIADTAAADAGPTAYYDNPALLCKAGSGPLSLTFSDSGVRLGCFNGSNFNSIAVAANTSNWHLAVARWNATDIELSVDHGSWTTTARTVELNTSGDGTLRVGANQDAASAGDFFDGRIAEMMTMTSRISDGDVTSLVSYFNSRYGLSIP